VKSNPVVAIAGVTGAVGAEFIATMDKRAFRVGKLKALASARSAGKTIDFRGQKVVIEELNESSFEGVDIALFSAGGGISRKFTPIAVKAGAVVVDNSSAFRMDPNVPLVIPEINADRIGDHKGIIAVPNCAAITVLVPLWPIHRRNRIKRVILSTYQAASGAGAAAMQELVESTQASLNGQAFQPKAMPYPYIIHRFIAMSGKASCPRIGPAMSARKKQISVNRPPAVVCRSPHERSDMRVRYVRKASPGYRFAHPGYACWASTG